MGRYTVYKIILFEHVQSCMKNIVCCGVVQRARAWGITGTKALIPRAHAHDEYNQSPCYIFSLIFTMNSRQWATRHEVTGLPQPSYLQHLPCHWRGRRQAGVTSSLGLRRWRWRWRLSLCWRIYDAGHRRVSTWWRHVLRHHCSHCPRYAI